MKKFDVCVVVPTYNRPRLIINCLNALKEQDFPRDNFEVVVVDDGSKDSSTDGIRKWSKDNPQINLTIIKEENKGPAAARNRGIKQSSADIVAFTDDDCQPDKGWISALYDFLQKHPDKLGVGGVTYTDPEKTTPLTSQIVNSIESDYPTCNVAYRKSTLSKIGGFNESYPVTNEDIDITWRIEELGEIGHENKMRVKHPPRRDSFVKTMKGVRNLKGEFILWELLPIRYKKEHIHPIYFLLVVYLLKLPLKKLIKALPWMIKNPLVNLWLLVILISERVYLIYLLPGFIYQSYKRRNNAKQK